MTGYLAREDKKHTLFTFTNKDLGTVERGKTYEVEFDYRNTTDSLLVIHDVRHSCDCVVPQWKNAPLRKGGEWKTDRTFHAQGAWLQHAVCHGIPQPIPLPFTAHHKG